LKKTETAKRAPIRYFCERGSRTERQKLSKEEMMMVDGAAVTGPCSAHHSLCDRSLTFFLPLPRSIFPAQTIHRGALLITVALTYFLNLCVSVRYFSINQQQLFYLLSVTRIRKSYPHQEPGLLYLHLSGFVIYRLDNKRKNTPEAARKARRKIIFKGQ
jgi:hypothetical protein